MNSDISIILILIYSGESWGSQSSEFSGTLLCLQRLKLSLYIKRGCASIRHPLTPKSVIFAFPFPSPSYLKCVKLPCKNKKFLKTWNMILPRFEGAHRAHWKASLSYLIKFSMLKSISFVVGTVPLKRSLFFLELSIVVNDQFQVTLYFRLPGVYDMTLGWSGNLLSWFLSWNISFDSEKQVEQFSSPLSSTWSSLQSVAQMIEMKSWGCNCCFLHSEVHWWC